MLVLMIGIDVDHVQMSVGQAIDANGRLGPHHSYSRHIRKPARYVLKILLLVIVGIVAVVIPVDAAAEVAEILGAVIERILLPKLELHIVDQVLLRRGAGVEDNLREVYLIGADLGPGHALGEQPDQTIAIRHYEKHGNPELRLGEHVAESADNALAKIARDILAAKIVEGQNPACRRRRTERVLHDMRVSVPAVVLAVHDQAVSFRR